MAQVRASGSFHSSSLPFGFAQGRADSVRMTGLNSLAQVECIPISPTKPRKPRAYGSTTSVRRRGLLYPIKPEPGLIGAQPAVHGLWSVGFENSLMRQVADNVGILSELSDPRSAQARAPAVHNLFSAQARRLRSTVYVEEFVVF